ncbi:hypothetical protein E5676_scaffold233G00070 [Cucumis melo var. makuwa]|uniref:Uncharacterized protein n=2 Tax=Cucumis melo TaxID=3656 RepID=A0A5D3BAD0_CUCMM|nr:hypothetical protein [Cucumis melo subsp. melo]KAA0066983.1 hypothetical protein E6C27_scaffold38G00070 [Cucumis melo var. makuwa]TYJ96792.1 hypothetical protein E5676_scaffold233G00070 [Cucumis melo var. makuwa]
MPLALLVARRLSHSCCASSFATSSRRATAVNEHQSCHPSRVSMRVASSSTVRPTHARHSPDLREQPVEPLPATAASCLSCPVA